MFEGYHSNTHSTITLARRHYIRDQCLSFKWNHFLFWSLTKEDFFSFQMFGMCKVKKNIWSWSRSWSCVACKCEASFQWGHLLPSTLDGRTEKGLHFTFHLLLSICHLFLPTKHLYNHLIWVLSLSLPIFSFTCLDVCKSMIIIELSGSYFFACFVSKGSSSDFAFELYTIPFLFLPQLFLKL